ncbi:putative guanine nucleotide exchange factor DBS-like isoform 1 [Penaeus vannamei]|uniref:Putative guanine nucleotide exchange factor DBS-like isoform 1 n=1 Tax=Penaeus vannamei TaxID=6689 RepID=A0A423SDT0_PENVA|nr:putative guanine nucleotide exchange factor DBS-like isoform 1 [Penaeus vannamei]
MPKTSPNRRGKVALAVVAVWGKSASGKSREGCPILTFPDKGNFAQLGDEEYRKLIIYLTSVPSLQDADMGFVLVIDRRNDKWNSVKTVLLKISGFFPGLITVAYVLRPAGFFQKAISEVSNKIFRDEFKFRNITRIAIKTTTKIVNKTISRVHANTTNPFHPPFPPQPTSTPSTSIPTPSTPLSLPTLHPPSTPTTPTLHSPLPLHPPPTPPPPNPYPSTPQTPTLHPPTLPSTPNPYPSTPQSLPSTPHPPNPYLTPLSSHPSPLTPPSPYPPPPNPIYLTSSHPQRPPLSLQVVVCNCVADLHEYIDRNQLTEDLDGCIPYNHDEWIEQRVVGARRQLMSSVTSLTRNGYVTSRSDG